MFISRWWVWVEVLVWKTRGVTGTALCVCAADLHWHFVSTQTNLSLSEISIWWHWGLGTLSLGHFSGSWKLIWHSNHLTSLPPAKPKVKKYLTKPWFLGEVRMNGLLTHKRLKRGAETIPEREIQRAGRVETQLRLSMCSTETAGMPCIIKKIPHGSVQAQDGEIWVKRESRRDHKKARCRVVDHVISGEWHLWQVSWDALRFQQKETICESRSLLFLVIATRLLEHIMTKLGWNLIWNLLQQTTNTFLSSRHTSPDLLLSWSDSVCKLPVEKVAEPLDGENKNTKTPNWDKPMFSSVMEKCIDTWAVSDQSA